MTKHLSLVPLAPVAVLGVVSPARADEEEYDCTNGGASVSTRIDFDFIVEPTARGFTLRGSTTRSVQDGDNCLS